MNISNNIFYSRYYYYYCSNSRVFNISHRVSLMLYRVIPGVRSSVVPRNDGLYDGLCMVSSVGDTDAPARSVQGCTPGCLSTLIGLREKQKVCIRNALRVVRIYIGRIRLNGDT